MTPSKAKKISKQPRWHPHYDDESADVTFISNDLVKFGVSLKLLAKSSTVFAGMKSLPPPDSQSIDFNQSTVEIDLDHDEETVLGFLELVSIHIPERLIMNYDFDECSSILALVEQYDCSKLHDQLCEQLYLTALCEKRSWELFSLGAARNDWAMGRQGLKGMCHDEVRQLLAKTTFKALLQDLSPDWQLALSSAILDSSFNHRRPMLDWSNLVSEFFDPGSLIDEENASREAQQSSSSSAQSSPIGKKRKIVKR